MYYSILDSRLRHVIDSHKTGDYGEAKEGDTIFCDGCQGRIRAGEEYYVVRNRVFCSQCESDAEEQILGLVRNEFLYQL